MRKHTTCLQMRHFFTLVQNINFWRFLKNAGFSQISAMTTWIDSLWNFLSKNVYFYYTLLVFKLQRKLFSQSTTKLRGRHHPLKQHAVQESGTCIFFQCNVTLFLRAQKYDKIYSKSTLLTYLWWNHSPTGWGLLERSDLILRFLS